MDTYDMLGVGYAVLIIMGAIYQYYRIKRRQMHFREISEDGNTLLEKRNSDRFSAYGGPHRMRYEDPTAQEQYGGTTYTLVVETQLNRVVEDQRLKPIADAALVSGGFYGRTVRAELQGVTQPDYHSEAMLESAVSVASICLELDYDTAVNQLLSRIGDGENGNSRWLATLVFRHLSDEPRVASFAREVPASANPILRVEAAIVEQNMEKLSALILTHPTVRLRALTALAELTDIAPTLRELMDTSPDAMEPDYFNYWTPTADDVPRLRAILQSMSNARSQAATALGKVGTVSQVELLMAVSEQDSDPSVSAAAQQAIEMLQEGVSTAAGGLSLADTSSGAVSMVEEPGELSLMPTEDITS